MILQTNSYEKQIRGPSSEPALHYGVYCDYCNYTIRGMRWKCASCKNYDLCQDCKPKSHIYHYPYDHVFELVPHSVTSNRSPRFAVHYGIMCKRCNSEIRGMRWECTFCQDYNLCQDCKSTSLYIYDHPNNHAFRPIGYQDNLFFYGFTKNAICDYCKSDCVGGRCCKCANVKLSYIKAI
ncbi:unnamed protein product [Rhizophagus irregularis]|nr:unnamed protein product [Rhizophagus irregularis]